MAAINLISMDRDLAADILKRCFPLADNLNIIQDQLEDGKLHFSSNITRFVVEFEQDHKVHQKQLVMKAPMSSAATSELLEELNFFETEIMMYEKVIPRINEYLDQSLAPAHLYTTESKILVLEDLTACGYESGEKLALLDFPQTQGAMNALAHFHAASHKLYTIDGNIWKNLDVLWIESDMRKAFLAWEPIVLELLRRKNETRLMRIVQAAVLFFKKDDDEIGSLINHSMLEFVVLNHGDFRKDNILFKCLPNNQVEVQFIDFQVCFWSSPLLDIIYFFMTSVSVEVINVHFNDLIHEYLKKLNDKVKKLDCPKIFERGDFDEEFKSLRWYLVLCALASCTFVCPLNRQQIQDTLFSAEANSMSISCFLDACLNDETFVHTTYNRLKLCEKWNLFDDY